MDKQKTQIAYKGMDSKMRCRGFQYEVNKEYETDESISLCNCGFHACENPFDVFDYYDPSDGNRFFEVEQGGVAIKGDDKTVSSKIKIKAELSFSSLLKMGFRLVFEKIKVSVDTKHTSGDSAHANTSGDRAHANTSGDRAHANTSGKESIACALGFQSKSMAKQGWIVIVDWREGKEGNWFIKQIYHAKVGDRIKCRKILPDVWYWFEDGKLKSEKAVS
jgi:hypothetical protein